MGRETGENWPDRHPPKEVGMGPDPVGSCKPGKELGPTIWGVRLPGGGGGGKRWCCWQCGCGGPGAGDRCELRQGRLAGADTGLGASVRSHEPWEPWGVLNRGGTGSDLCFRKTQGLPPEGKRLETGTREDRKLSASQSLLLTNPGPVHHLLSP